jgi:hypothetical protein
MDLLIDRFADFFDHVSGYWAEIVYTATRFGVPKKPLSLRERGWGEGKESGTGARIMPLPRHSPIGRGRKD